MVTMNNGLPLYSDQKSAGFVKFLMENMPISKADCDKAAAIIAEIEKDYPELKNTEQKMKNASGKGGVKVVHGDITTFKGDLIINSTNASFSCNAGVSGAIATAAGRQIIMDCESHVRKAKSGPKICAGSFCITPGYALDAKKVLHFVAPKHAKDGVAGVNAIQAMIRHVFEYMTDVKSFAMPCIATGHNGYPIGLVMPVVMFALLSLTQDHPNVLVSVYANNDADYKYLCMALQRAQELYRDTPEWVVRVCRRTPGDGKLTKQDTVIVDCRYAGRVEQLRVTSHTNNYPEFKIDAIVNDAKFECGMKQSAMTYAGGIYCEDACVNRHMPDGIPYLVEDGMRRTLMHRYELCEFIGDAECKMWCTDPRLMLAGYVALLGEQDRIDEIVGCLPSRYEAEAILDYYKLRCPVIYNWSHDKQFDCYPRMDRMYKDMRKLKGNFAMKVLTRIFHGDCGTV